MINCPTCEFADFEKDKCTRLLIRLPHICPYAEERKPRNNFEMLKAMSMEEMAAYLADHPIVRPFNPDNEYHRAWLKWLKEEVGE